MLSFTLLFVFLSIVASSSYPKMKLPPLSHTQVRNHDIKPTLLDIQLPVNFSFESSFPQCKYPILNQGDCGSCWAFGSTGALQARFCKSIGSSFPALSPQHLLECEKENLGCTMGSPPGFAWDFLKDTGTTSLKCTPYVSGDGSVPKCHESCSSSNQFKLYQSNSSNHIGSYFSDDKKRSIAIQQEIFINGPVDATFNVYADFDEYTGGVYQHQHGGYEGLHSVTIIGWGVENSIDYWLVRNSWGPDFGIDNGYFKIIRGINDCLFEEFVYSGLPRLS